MKTSSAHGLRARGQDGCRRAVGLFKTASVVTAGVLALAFSVGVKEISAYDIDGIYKSPHAAYGPRAIQLVSTTTAGTSSTTKNKDSHGHKSDEKPMILTVLGGPPKSFRKGVKNKNNINKHLLKKEEVVEHDIIVKHYRGNDGGWFLTLPKSVKEELELPSTKVRILEHAFGRSLVFGAGKKTEEDWYQFGGYFRVCVKILGALTLGLFLPIVLASPLIRSYFPQIMKAVGGIGAPGGTPVGYMYLTPTPLFAALMMSTTWILLLLASPHTPGQIGGIVLELCSLCATLCVSVSLVILYPFFCQTGWSRFPMTYFVGVALTVTLLCTLILCLVIFGSKSGDALNLTRRRSFFAFLQFLAISSTVIMFLSSSWNNVFGGNYKENPKNMAGTVCAVLMAAAWWYDGRVYLGHEVAIHWPAGFGLAYYTSSLIVRAVFLPSFLEDQERARARTPPEQHKRHATISSTSERAVSSVSDINTDHGEGSACEIDLDLDRARGRHVSLGNTDRASRFVAHIPLSIVLTITGTFAYSWLWDKTTFVCLFLGTSCWMLGFLSYMGVFSAVGLYRIRKACAKNWSREWEEYLEANPVVDEGLLHFVLITNENQSPEGLLSQTIANLGNSTMSKYMVCVLAMEEREADEDREVAERLIAKHGALFLDMFATYHPPDLPGEVRGKGACAQWAFRDIQRWHADYVKTDAEHEGGISITQFDASKVFVTQMDTDTIFHKEHFANLTLNAMQMKPEDRCWTAWQAPVLQWRNWAVVPRIVRPSVYGNNMNEISGCSASPYVPHCTSNTFTMTLALLSHPAVDGWSEEEVCEDHHMTFKAFYASHWESLAGEDRSVRSPSKFKITPLYTPVSAFVAADGDSTVRARFLQSKRDMQAVHQYAYFLLQYFNICCTSYEPLPWSAHFQCLLFITKYGTLYILSCIQEMIVVLTFMLLPVVMLLSPAAREAFFAAWETLSHMRADSPALNLMCILVEFGTPITYILVGFVNRIGLILPPVFPLYAGRRSCRRGKG
ncbi:unnamed protein product [Amoebophrya sp. A25]|nr:unnamed protein product [Amoebophrya sp. A25]|eukprot:GSA25T00006929001.1